jgi:CRP/FNR family transcriptional regulator, cyclic AMP receptor protein
VRESRHGYVVSVATVPVLRLDPDLGGGMEAARRQLAERVCLAPTVDVARGKWDAEAAGKGDRSGYGLLVVSGILCRRVVQNKCWGAELVGPGDLLRPWDLIGDWSSIPTESDWLVVEPARVAVLDGEFARRASAFPEIAMTLIRRGLLRSRYLALLIAIISQRRIETRLTMLFWHLADRFGQVRGEWVTVPVPLTHTVLSELIGARRPSVSTALSRLQKRGTVVREGNGWLLRGPAPAEYDRLRSKASAPPPADIGAPG